MENGPDINLKVFKNGDGGGGEAETAYVPSYKEGGDILGKNVRLHKVNLLITFCKVSNEV